MPENLIGRDDSINPEKEARRSRPQPKGGLVPFSGAMQRFCEHLAGNIVKTVNPKLREKAQEGARSGYSLHIPLFIEANRFSFEKEARDLWNPMKVKIKEAKTILDKKLEEATNLCPYEGTPLFKEVEQDHIIPRSGKWGTLNSEMNLIPASPEGNRKKGNSIYDLGRLNKEHLKDVFGEVLGEDIPKLTLWIDNQIQPYLDKKKTFRNFATLNEQDKRAFRYGLFLMPQDLAGLNPKNPETAQDYLLSVLQTSYKTRVNGTQSYLIQNIKAIMERRLVREGIPRESLIFTVHLVDPIDYRTGFWADKRRKDLNRCKRFSFKCF